MKYIDRKGFKIKKDIYGYGCESALYKVINSNQLYKVWKTRDYNEIMNKVKKLQLLETKEEILDSIAKVDTLVYSNFEYSGCLVDYYDGYELDSLGLNFLESIKTLKKIREVIVKFYNNGVMYLDMSPENILCKKNNNDIEMKFIDVDNIQIDSYPMDCMPPFLRGYLKNGGKIDFNSLIFSFNYLTRNMLIPFDIRLANLDHIPDNFACTYNKYIAKIVRGINECEVDGISNNEYLLDYYNEKELVLK